MHVFRLAGVAFWALSVVFAGPAEARRIALVMGNADYKIGPLQNPVKDAAAVAETFERELGFDKVILRKDLSFDGFRSALNELAREASNADVAVVYFAGHGMEINGKNFLIPVDAKLGRASAVDLEAVPLDTVLAQLDGVRHLKLVILDACRNNPFTGSWKKRATHRGLARIEPEDSTLVVYAAKDGTTADDGAGRQHSPFTEALLKHIATPNVEVRLLLGRVGDDVAAATNHQQQPHVYGTLGGREHYLLSKAADASADAPAAQSPGERWSPQLSEPERAWATVKDSASIAVLEAFRQQYGASNALYDRLAAERIGELRRIEEGKRVAAAHPAPSPALAPAAPTPPALPDLARLLQVELKRVGCDPGAIDGVWGDKGEAALARFARHAKLSLATDEATGAALEAVKSRRSRICPLECGPGTVERKGTCVATAAPARKPAKSRAARSRSQPARASRRAEDSRRQKRGGSKSGMCWAIDARVNTLVPCSDPRASIKAY